MKTDLIAVPEDVSEEITESDRQRFLVVTATDLSPDQERRLRVPDRILPDQREVMAIHWHPEFIPVSLVDERIRAMYPGKENELIIPTQHNHLVAFGPFSGVEVDCYSRGFNQKVQLLLHYTGLSDKACRKFRAWLI